MSTDQLQDLPVSITWAKILSRYEGELSVLVLDLRKIQGYIRTSSQQFDLVRGWIRLSLSSGERADRKAIYTSLRASDSTLDALCYHWHICVAPFMDLSFVETRASSARHGTESRRLEALFD